MYASSYEDAGGGGLQTGPVVCSGGRDAPVPLSNVSSPHSAAGRRPGAVSKLDAISSPGFIVGGSMAPWEFPARIAPVGVEGRQRYCLHL